MELVILFLTGIIATTIGTLAGGGGFISLPTMILLGVPIHSAIGANKVSNTFSSFSSFFYLYKHKKISLQESFWIIPISLFGGISGGYLATRISAENLSIIAIFLLIFAFVTSFFKMNTFTGEGRLKPNKFSIPGLYGIGIYDGVFGPGQGTLMMYLFGYLKVSYIRAVGCVRLATFSSCFGAAVTYIVTDQILWHYTLCLLLGSVTGAQIGVRVAEKIQLKFVKSLLRFVTAGLILQMTLNQLL